MYVSALLALCVSYMHVWHQHQPQVVAGIDADLATSNTGPATLEPRCSVVAAGQTPGTAMYTVSTCAQSTSPLAPPNSIQLAL